MAQVVVVPHGSAEYWQTIELRRRILRIPLGLDFAQAELESESREFHFAAFRDGQLVGCLVMNPQNCSVVKMRQVAVDPSVQGAGIGTALVQASEEWAKSQGYSQIELNARDTAIPFYARLDYQTVGDEFTEVSIPHRKMVKDLTG